jgi:hypothetical protein
MASRVVDLVSGAGVRAHERSCEFDITRVMGAFSGASGGMVKRAAVLVHTRDQARATQSPPSSSTNWSLGGQNMSVSSLRVLMMKSSLGKLWKLAQHLKRDAVRSGGSMAGRRSCLGCED